MKQQLHIMFTAAANLEGVSKAGNTGTIGTVLVWNYMSGQYKGCAAIYSAEKLSNATAVLITHVLYIMFWYSNSKSFNIPLYHG